MLERFFNPASIALIGASENPEKIGGKILRTLQKQGYPGRLYPVNPGRESIAGLPAYARVGQIPDDIDLALVAVPARQVPAALQECADKAIAAAVVFSSGFSEEGEEGLRLQQEIAEICRRTGLRVSGPNAEGFFSVRERVAATFSPGINIDAPLAQAPAASLGIVSQSGGLGFSIYNRGRRRNLDFSHIVSVGNQVDLEINDYLGFMLDQPQVRAVLMYTESLRDPRAFVRLAQRAAALGKPIIMAKVGRSSAGQRAALSHTGAIAGSARVSDAVLDHCGILRADDQDELLDIATAVAHQPPLRGRRVAIVSTSGGTGVWLADTLEAQGFEVPPIDAARREQLGRFIPSYGSTDNPVDITAQGNDGYARSLEILGEADYVDAIVIAASFAHEKRLLSEGADIARAARAIGKPVLFYSYSLPSAQSLRLLDELGLQCYTTLTGCARGLAGLWKYSSFQRELAQRFVGAEHAAVPQGLAALLAGPDPALCEYEAKQLAAACGVKVPEERLARDAAEAAAFAQTIGFPVALKVQSPDIAHKTEAGAIRLGLMCVADVAQAHDAVLAAAHAHAPDAKVHGVLVQPMARRGLEMMAGILQDRDFGPVVMVGMGGIFAEVLDDAAFAPAPLSIETARAMIDRLKGRRLLEGARGEPVRDKEALAQLLVALGHLAVATEGALQEMDFNPVIVHEAGAGVTIVDALGVRKK